VDGEHRSGHHRDQCSRGDGSNEAEGDQKAAGELGQRCQPRVKLAWTGTDLVEGVRRALNATSAPGAGELQGGVRDEGQSYDQPQSQECDFHCWTVTASRRRLV